MTVGIRLADGAVIGGESWADVEDGWAARFMNAVIPRDEFRSEIQRRGVLWSGVEMAIDGSAEDFMHEAERAGLITMIRNVNAARPRPDVLVPMARLVFLEAQKLARMAREQRNAAKAEKGF